MSLRRDVLLFALTFASIACAHPGPTVQHASSSPRPAIPTEHGTTDVPSALASQQCAESSSPPSGFAVDEAALQPFATAATSSAPPIELAEGRLRVGVPSAWFPSRVDGENFVAYQIRTGSRADVIGMYFGDSPAFHPRNQGEFRLLSGPLAIRGYVWLEGTRHAIEALVRIPCGTPRYLHIWARSESEASIANVVALVHSIRWADDRQFTSRDVTLETARDATALGAMTAHDPVARELVTRSLAGVGLRSRYRLDTVHPLADQVLSGRFPAELSGIRTEIWSRIPVHQGTATAPAMYHSVIDGSFAREVATLAHAGCHATAILVTDEGLAVRCESESDTRVGIRDATDAHALIQALHDFLHVRATMDHWHRDPASVGNWPSSLCAGDTVRIEPSGDTMFVARDRCVVAIDAARETVLSTAMEGDCESVPVQPWSANLRSVGRFDDVRGPHGTYCRFTLGWNGRTSWVIAVGDHGTTSSPISNAPSMAVDYHAVNTAVAFLHDLLAFATGRSDETPINVLPSVLHALGVDRIGSPESEATLRMFQQHGGFEGPGVSAVLGARTVDSDHVEITFMPVVVELTQQPAGWVVTGMRPSRIGSP